MDELVKTESIKLEIELFKDGQLSVKCPLLADTMLMCGLLEMAKAVAFQHRANLNKSNIVKPEGGIMNFVRNRMK